MKRDPGFGFGHDSAYNHHKRAMRERRLPPIAKQCPDCRGSGCTSAELNIPTHVMRMLAEQHPDEPIENYISRQICAKCQGTGSYGLE